MLPRGWARRGRSCGVLLGMDVRGYPVGLLYELVVDFADGMATMPIHAATVEEAFRAGQELFPGQRVVVVLKDEQLEEGPLEV